MIGLHLIIDGVSTKPMEKATVNDVLNELPGKIDMKILAGPLVVAGKPANPGWTGFVIIDKSHISIHTFSTSNLVSVDVFSCMFFDVNIVKDYLLEKLNLNKLNIQVINRSESKDL
ncbi:S-adenosylmethionine decarboxylase proenzyme [Candidatus Bathyarchaeota archaeon]|nr:S-adenosylmethionine decarboxylase proenzyme [Candidatus Bathyarchaeota archaeon]